MCVLVNVCNCAVFAKRSILSCSPSTFHKGWPIDFVKTKLLQKVTLLVRTLYDMKSQFLTTTFEDEYTDINFMSKKHKLIK